MLYFSNMKLFPAIACLVSVSVFAGSPTRLGLGASPYADTEISTNIVLHKNRTDTRDMDIHFQFLGTSTNELEIAFGRDVNANGVLDVEEVETIYGWRGGRYFIEDVLGWNRIETGVSSSGTSEVFDVHVKNDAEIVPKRFAASCGGNAIFPELATLPPPPWLFRRQWNMARVTRRGAGTPSEWVRCDIKYEQFAIRLR